MTLRPRLVRQQDSAVAYRTLALIAVCSGVLIATQPLSYVAALLGLLALVLLALLTPISAIAVLLVVAPLRTLIATESPLQLPLDIGQLGLIAVLGTVAVYRITHRQPLLRTPSTPVPSLLLLFCAASALSLFTAYSPSAWLNEWLKWVQIVILVIIVSQDGTGTKWQWLLFGLTVAGIANALVGLYEFFGGSGALHLLINNRFFRAFGTFGQPNPFGGFMGLIAPLALGATAGFALHLWRHWRITRRVSHISLACLTFYATASLLLVSGVFISWSRGAWLAFAASLVVMVVAWPRRLWHSAALLIFALALGGGLWATGRLPASIVERINSATQELFTVSDVRGVDITAENYAVVERLAHWQAALNMARAHPWTGVGFGNYEVAYPEFRLINWKFPLGHAHNYYLNVLAETGIIGLAAYLLLWLGVVAVAWRARRHPNALSRSVVVGLIGTAAYLSVHSLTDNLYVNNLFLHIGVIFGILVVLYQQCHINKRIRMT